MDGGNEDTWDASATSLNDIQTDSIDGDIMDVSRSSNSDSMQLHRVWKCSDCMQFFHTKEQSIL